MKATDVPWSEKYRPDTLDGVVGNDDSVNRMKQYVDDGGMTNLLLYGPAGTGKTTAAIALAKEIYGDDWEANFIEKNASDDRGIDVVREEIKSVAQQSTAGQYPFKIIFLDESDNLCVPAGTKVITGYPSSPETKNIEDVSQKGEKIPSVDFETNEIQPDSGRMLETGTAEFYRLELSDGREVVASPEHPFFTVSEKEELLRTELRDLEPGDEIADFSDAIDVTNCICGKFTVNEKYCSEECQNTAHSERMSGESNPMSGESWSEERREKIISKLSDGRLDGENNPNYNGDFHGERVWDMDEEVQERVCEEISNYREGTELSQEHRNAIARSVKEKLYGKNVDEEYQSQNYRYHLKDKDEVECEICGDMKKVGRNDGIYVHHIDGNRNNNCEDNLMDVCPRCHNFICHDRWDDILEGWKENDKRKDVVSDGGRNVVDTVEVENITFDHSGKAYNITMDDTPNFMLANGILTHNTKDAQSALRRTMETYSDQTRFILNANYHNKLLSPIQSRCSLLPFKRLDDDEIGEILQNIIAQEDINAEDEAVDEIIDYVQGDARRAVHTLQMSVRDGELSSDTLEFVNLQASREDIQEMIELAVNGEIEEAMDMNVKDIQPRVTDHSRFCQNVMSVLKQTDEFSTDTRFYAMSQVGDMERNILEGASPSVQTNSFLAKLPVIDNSGISNYE